MQPIEEIEAAAREARAAVRAALDEVGHAPLTQQIESYARAQALLVARLLIAEIARRLATETLTPAAIGPLLADALAAALRGAAGMGGD